jgi:hypothetical protein
LGGQYLIAMQISAERFKALLDGTATNVTGEERIIRIEAFNAERRGEDPAVAVQAKLPHVSILEVVQVTSPLSGSATNIITVSVASAERLCRLTRLRAASERRWLYGFALTGLLALVVWFAVAGGMAIIVAHFIGVAMFGLFIQGVNWFFRAPATRRDQRSV